MNADKTMRRDDFEGMWPSVMWFANEMQRQLNENDHKTGWESLSAKWLLNRLKQETSELERAIKLGKKVTEEAADVANFAMMIADNFADQTESKAKPA